MEHDLFQAEETALRIASTAHAHESLDSHEYRTALGDLITQFRRLVRESRRLIVHSDRQERELTKLNDQLQQLAAELEYKATHDALTAALNRGAVIARTDAYLQEDSLALVVLDIDHFKNVNDQFGHPAGDAVIAELVVRLRGCVPTLAEIGRVGGEEFTVLLPRMGFKDAVSLSERMRRHVADRPFRVPNGYNVTASFGVSFTQRGGSFEEAYGNADQALYQAKREGRNTVRPAFDTDLIGLQAAKPTDDEAIRLEQGSASSQTESAITQILERGSAPLALQRIRTALSQPEKFWYEALLRPIQFGVSVSEILSSAAASSRELNLDRVVLLSALDILAADGAIDMLCVNLCRATCTDSSLSDLIADRMTTLGITHSRLCVEFPETADTNSKPVISAMRRWRENGAIVAIDDVGNGTSILLPLLLGVVDIVKLDAMVLRDVDSHGDGGLTDRLIRTVGFLESMGAIVVFEGVETQKQTEWLSNLPTTAAQGFAISGVVIRDP